jgi:hypothetical protein
MNMDQNDELMSTRLEEQMFNVAEQYIDVLIAEWRHIAKTILVDLDLTGHSFTIKRWSKIDIRKLDRAAVCGC